MIATATVELLGIGRTFGSEPPVVALRDVDLTVDRATSVAIVDPRALVSRPC
jgi:hypothetical protein